MIGISGSQIWSKTWWNWYLTPVVNFSEVQRAQFAKSTLLIFTLVLLGSFKVCSDAKERVACRKHQEATAPILSLVKLQPGSWVCGGRPAFGRITALGSCACSEGPTLGQNIDENDYKSNRNIPWQNKTKHIRSLSYVKTYPFSWIVQIISFIHLLP